MDRTLVKFLLSLGRDFSSILYRPRSWKMTWLPTYTIAVRVWLNSNNMAKVVVINVYRPLLGNAADNAREDVFQPSASTCGHHTLFMGDFRAYHDNWDPFPLS
jgi:hypothetical protein